jgi:hypothetical protein
MIYYKNLQTNNIIEFENENSVGQAFYNTQEFIRLTQNESDAYVLQKAKDARKNYILNKRMELCEKGVVEYQGNTYANAQNARIAILNYITTLPSNTSTAFYIKYPSRGPIELTKADFKALADAIQGFEATKRQAEYIAYIAIDNAITVEEINNIDL